MQHRPSPTRDQSGRLAPVPGPWGSPGGLSCRHPYGPPLLLPCSTEASPELRARILESLIAAGEAAEAPAAPGKRCPAGGGVGGSRSEIQGGDSSMSRGGFDGRCGDGEVSVSLRWCLGCAGSLASHAVPSSPSSFLLRETGFGAFLCSPSGGLQLFSCLMSMLLLFGPGVVQAGLAPPFQGLGRCGCSWSGAAVQLVLACRDLAAV